MASRDSPGSPLSSIDTVDSSDHESAKQGSRAHSPSTSNMPPSKRRRTGMASWDRQTPLSSVQDEMPPPTSPTASISSDSSGDIPHSPSLLALLGTHQDEDYSGQAGDQVTVCRWDGCNAGDLGNMDGLVQHIHNDHIGSRQKRYSCEWIDCSRKGQTHASAYALRAHMRSHTREKPFYCTLPECDRNFTRSDALTKHMRSVHEAEALRQADSSSKSHAPAAGSTAGTPASKLQRIRLKLPHPPKEPGVDAEHYSEPPATEAAAPDAEELIMPEFTPDLGFDDHELNLRPRDLYRLLRRQIAWAEKESAQLQAEWEKIRPRRERAWLEKESIFDDVIDGELRLFSAIVGSTTTASSDDIALPSAPAANLAESLEKLQHQQQLLQRHSQELQKQSKAADAEEIESTTA